MTAERLQPLLNHNKVTKQFCQVAELLSGAQVLASVRDAIRLGRLTTRATVTSTDGIGVCNLISRSAMMQGIHKVHGAAVHFVSMLCGTASTCVWEDDEGTTHKIIQSERGEQGDAMMPPSLSQHPALEAVQAHPVHGEHLFAYLNDIYVVSTPQPTGTVYTLLQNGLWRVAGIRTHQGKTKVWNRSGEKHAVCDVLERMARITDTTASGEGHRCARESKGTKVLGTPLGHRDFVRVHLESTAADRQLLLDRIPLLEDLQSSWLLLVHCAAARAKRAVEPAAQEF